MPNFNFLLKTAKKAIYEAGEAILEIYKGENFGIESKKDNSPVTIADKKAHEIIANKLQETKLPILSEEGEIPNYETRKNWEYFWCIDPIDATRAFIKKTGEFTVNIALIHENKAIMGLILLPTKGKLYFASQNIGAFVEKKGRIKSLKVEPKNYEQKEIRVVCSRSYNAKTKQFINGINEPEIICKSSSLKFLELVEDKADVYPRLSNITEWDTAAGQAILEIAGGSVLTYPSLEPMPYNKPNLKNDYFIAISNKNLLPFLNITQV